jgi:hypothetical protein
LGINTRVSEGEAAFQKNHFVSHPSAEAGEMREVAKIDELPVFCPY